MTKGSRGIYRVSTMRKEFFGSLGEAEAHQLCQKRYRLARTMLLGKGIEGAKLRKVIWTNRLANPFMAEHAWKTMMSMVKKGEK